MQLSSCNAFLPNLVADERSLLVIVTLCLDLVIVADFAGKLFVSSGNVSIQALHCFGVWFRLSSCDNSLQASVLKATRKSPFAVSWCHFLLKSAQMA